MNFKLHRSTDEIFIRCKEGIVNKVSDGFIKLTGYLDYEILGKSIEHLNDLLKLNYQKPLDSIEQIHNVFIFIKGDIPIEFNITSQYSKYKYEWTYHFEEVPNSTINSVLLDVFSFDFDSKKAIALYSLESCILLQSNKQYIDLLLSLDISVDNLIGHPPIHKDLFLDFSNKRKYGHEKEVEFKGKDQQLVYFDIAISPLHSNGKEKYLLNMIYDVTDKVLARKRVERQIEEMITISDKISDGVVAVNAEGRCTYTNNAASNMINIHLGGFDDTKFQTLDGIQVPFKNTPIQRVIRGELFSDYILIGTKNDISSYYQIHGFPLYDNKNIFSSGVLIYHNITDRMIIEEYNVLKDKAKGLSLHYTSLTYPGFKILYMNNEAFTSLQYANPNIKDVFSIIGKNLFHVYNRSTIDEELELKSRLKEVIEKRQPIYSFIRKIIWDGELNYYKIIYQPVYNINNQVDKITMIGIDITEEERAKEELAKALKTQDETFINISHELKTPLNVIFSASQLIDIMIKKDAGINNQIESTNNIVLQNCYRLTKLINNILDISKIESGFYDLSLTNEDIVHVTEDIVHSIAQYIRNMELQIVFDTNIEEKIIAIDLYKFERIMLNLISNAIKFSNPKGVILINLNSKDDFIEISVQDFGIGIAKEHQDIIFNKFQQVNKSLNRKVEGTGIGLSLVKSLTDLHNGTITVDSTLGEGTTFTLKLPAITVDNQNVSKPNDRTGMIRFEFSDIYY